MEGVSVGSAADADDAAMGSGRPLIGLMATAVDCEEPCGSARASGDSASSDRLSCADVRILRRGGSSKF